jgi:hypothetical protein
MDRHQPDHPSAGHTGRDQGGRGQGEQQLLHSAAAAQVRGQVIVIVSKPAELDDLHRHG